MPELPEVETFRRQVHAVLKGHRLAEVNAVGDTLVFEGVKPTVLQKKLLGRRVVGSGRWGKHMWLELDEKPWPVFHFGMTGSFEIYRDPGDRPAFWKLELVSDDGQRVAYVNKRRLGRVRLVHDVAEEPPVAGLGFDPLLDLPAAAPFAAALARRKAPIKAVLLDQSFAAGVGNWVADEVLYQAGIAPRRLASSLTPAEARKLRTVLARVVKKAVEVSADADRFPKTWLFHVRWGKQNGARTARGEPLAFDTVGGRTTAWVPSAQR